MIMPKPHSPRTAVAHGFTLVELIIVIAITSIIAAFAVYLIKNPVQAYVDSVARAELSDIADQSLRRMTRDLRLALPNSVRISADGKYLEFIPTKTGGRYKAEEDELGLNNVLNFTAATPSPFPLQFDIVGTAPSGRQTIVAGDFIVVYNLGPGFSPANAYDCTGTCNLAKVASTSTSAGTTTVLLDTNPFVAQVPSFPSPTARFQVVTKPITYFCDDTVTKRLIRYSGYNFQPGQPVLSTAAPLSTAPVQARIADRVNSCTFTFTSLANVQRGLVTLKIELGSAGELLTLQHQIHVDNTP